MSRARIIAGVSILTGTLLLSGCGDSVYDDLKRMLIKGRGTIQATNDRVYELNKSLNKLIVLLERIYVVEDNSDQFTSVTAEIETVLAS